jgi:hypothetical protein
MQSALQQWGCILLKMLPRWHGETRAKSACQPQSVFRSPELCTELQSSPHLSCGSCCQQASASCLYSSGGNSSAAALPGNGCCCCWAAGTMLEPAAPAASPLLLPLLLLLGQVGRTPSLTTAAPSNALGMSEQGSTSISDRTTVHTSFHIAREPHDGCRAAARDARACEKQYAGYCKL